MAESTTAVLVDEHTTTTDDELTRLAGAWLAGHTSINTRRAYQQDLRDWFRWARAHDVDPLIGIRRTHVELWARHLEDRGLAPSTRHRRIGTVRSWYEWLGDEGLWETANPVRRVVQPRVTTVRPLNVLTKREMHILLDVAAEHSPRAHAIVALGYLNGLRISETCGADVTDLGRHGYHHTLRIVGKGDHHDEIPLPPPAVEAVQHAVGGRELGPLVVNTVGRRVDRKHAERLLTRLCKDAGITRITPHGLRRTAITLLFQEGVPAREIQLFARHASLETTLRYDQRRRTMDEHLGSVLIRAVA